MNTHVIWEEGDNGGIWWKVYADDDGDIGEMVAGPYATEAEATEAAARVADIDVAPWNLDAMAVGDLDQLAQGLLDLHRYAARKAKAMRFREEGNIPMAMRREDECDDIFGRLPAWAKW